MAAPIQRQLLEALKTVDRPGTFCTSGSLPLILPGLEVTSVGEIALPLEKRQAAALKKQARQAPYGKGTKTLVDTDVRRVWELDAEQVTLANPQWPNVVEQAVRSVQTELGLEEQELVPHLYKLLLYEPGSFFLAHRDGEKLDRMVATLVIALPSAHAGGELIVRHEGREVQVDFGAEGRFAMQYAAFYADCEHEVRPVTSGFRLALVYNLTLAKSKQAISAPTSREPVEAVARLLEEWRPQKKKTKKSVTATSPEEVRPLTKLAVVLDHKYSPAGLTRDTLKGIDRARADVLFAAAGQTGYNASLALVTKWVSGSAEPAGVYGYGYGYSRSRRYGRRRYEEEYEEDNDSEYEMGEVIDESLSAEHFSDADGHHLDFGTLPLDDGEIVAEGPLDEGEPDQEDFEGFTGNAGMTLDRWYHRAAIMLWPAESHFGVLCEAGIDAAVGGLEQMIRNWKQGKKSEREALGKPCLEFARQIIAHWPQREFSHGYRAGSDPWGDDEDYDVEFDDDDIVDNYKVETLHEEADDLAEETTGPDSPATQRPPRPSLLSLLAELQDASLIAAWLRGVLARDVAVDPGRTLGDLCQQHGWATFEGELKKLFENTSSETLERHARLLADWALRKDKNAGRQQLCAQLARQLVSAVERWDPSKAKRDWRARSVDRGKLLPPLVQAFLVLEEPELLERLVTFVVDRPREFDLTKVQVPALLHLKTPLKRSVKRRSLPLHRWLAAVQAELESRASQPPQAPADWRRESATGCKCADCKDLSRFLKDPHTKTLRLPLAEQRRRHLHGVIDDKRLDTTHETVRRGRPYVLVCTKTQASYERALKAHHVDLDHLKQIGELQKWHEGLPAKPERSASGKRKAKTAKAKSAKLTPAKPKKRK